MKSLTPSAKKSKAKLRKVKLHEITSESQYGKDKKKRPSCSTATFASYDNWSGDNTDEFDSTRSKFDQIDQILSYRDCFPLSWQRDQDFSHCGEDDNHPSLAEKVCLIKIFFMQPIKMS